jgi:hypothetical protein
LPSGVLDRHFGNHNALQMARQSHVPLIAKRRYEAALSCPSTGPYAGRGPHRTSGGKVAYPTIPAQDLQETTVEGHIQPRLYQAHLLHKAFAHALNVVIIVQMNLHPHTWGHVILFSSDQERSYDTLRDY